MDAMNLSKDLLMSLSDTEVAIRVDDETVWSRRNNKGCVGGTSLGCSSTLARVVELLSAALEQAKSELGCADKR